MPKIPCTLRLARAAKFPALATVSVLMSLLARPATAMPASGLIALPGHIPPAVSHAIAVDRLSAQRPVALALTLPLRNQAALDDFLTRVADPHDALYGHYLTPAEFAARFSPTKADYARVIAYAQSSGLTVTVTHSNRAVLDVSAPAAAVERAFHTSLLVYRSQADGRLFYAPSVEPVVPSALASVISGVVGLDSAARWHAHNRVLSAPAPDASNPQAWLQSYQLPLAGTGPNGGLTPANIKAAYNLSAVTPTGAGQTLGLFELDGYKASDVTFYESTFGLPAVPLQNVLVDGYSGAAGNGAGEVTLDIELQIALAPSATKVIVYEAPNSSAGVVDAYNRIATDNLAKEISTSWGEAENSATASVRNSENTAFQQMSAQGQSIFAAAGDSGANDNGSSLSVDDPASQPYMVSVGGTSLSTASAGGPYQSETTWNNGSTANGAGGGGISTVWPLPSYQSGVISAASKGSTTMRNVPDISLDANPNTGYAIYVGGAWNVYGGTSCAAPLWAAFTALVNQNRAASGSALLGFANPPIYAIAQSSGYASDFHDIADGSTNLFYPAVAGYDDATGWGTFNGANLLAALSPAATPPTVPAAPTGLKATAGSAVVSLSWTGSAGAASYNVYRGTASGAKSLFTSGVTATAYSDASAVNGTTYFYQVSAVNSAGESAKSGEASATPQAAVTSAQLLGNPGFENGSANPAPWTISAGVIDNSTGEAAHAGTWKAWMDGYGSTHADTLSQTVAIPAAIATASLNFYLHVDTAERGTTAYDTLKVQLRSTSGAVLKTLATYSNANAASGYALKSFDVSAFKGQSVQVYLVGTEDRSLQTSFVLDDFALNVK